MSTFSEIGMETRNGSAGGYFTESSGAFVQEALDGTAFEPTPGFGSAAALEEEDSFPVPPGWQSIGEKAVPFSKPDGTAELKNSGSNQTQSGADAVYDSEDFEKDCGEDEEEAEIVSDDTADVAEAEKKAKETVEEKRRREEHEAAEEKRKAEWEAERQAKKAEEQKKLERLAAMSDEEVMMESAKRVSLETERLTRRNMKECVSEHIQTMSFEDPVFARLILHPKKNMINCFRYINRKAKEFIMQEMEDNDIKPENGVYGGDVPDELCYQWAMDYFRDPDADEDKEKEEAFVPKPYNGKTASKGKDRKTAKKKPEKRQEKKAETKENQGMPVGQLSLLDLAKEGMAG